MLSEIDNRYALSISEDDWTYRESNVDYRRWNRFTIHDDRDMEDFLTAIIVSGLFYAVLRFFKISWLKQGFPHSFIYLAGVFAWCTGLALIASVYSFISMTIDLISSFDADTIIPFVVILAIIGVATKLLSDKKEVLDIAHMIPFLRSAILFKPYDAKRQELFERQEKMQRAQAQKEAAERTASGQTTSEAIDISDDAAGKNENSSQDTESPHAPSELDMLKRGEGVDISELFKSNTEKLPAHPLYQFISLIRIDPADKIMSFRMVFPSTATEPELTPEKLQRIKQGIYQVFQALTAEQWLKPYSPFFTSLKTSCFRSRKDEFDMMREILFSTVQMEINQLRLNRGKPFNSAEFAKIATITTEG